MTEKTGNLSSRNRPGKTNSRFVGLKKARSQTSTATTVVKKLRLVYSSDYGYLRQVKSLKPNVDGQSAINGVEHSRALRVVRD